jgi:hypothetical protein
LRHCARHSPETASGFDTHGASINHTLAGGRLGTSKMRVQPTQRGNFKVDAYFGPTMEPVQVRPQLFVGPRRLCAESSMIPSLNCRAQSGVDRMSTASCAMAHAEARLPWIAVRSSRLRCVLADRLRAYIPAPVVAQIDGGQTWSMAKRRAIATMFCKLKGIDFLGEAGTTATVRGYQPQPAAAVTNNPFGTLQLIYGRNRNRIRPT